MRDLGTELREWVDVDAPPIDLDALVGAPLPRRARPRLALATAALVTAGLVAGMTVLRSPTTPTIAGPATGGLPASAPAPPPIAVTDETPWRWELVDAELDSPRLVDGGDRALRVEAGSILRSFDGVTWADLTGPRTTVRGRSRMLASAINEGGAWQDTVVTWAGGGFFADDAGRTAKSATELRITMPDTVETRHFEGDVLAVGVGPGGVLVATGAVLDFSMIVISELGMEWDEQPHSVELVGDTLLVEREDGRTAEIDLPAAGYDPADLTASGLSRFSIGEGWVELEPLPGDPHRIVGTPSGFFTTLWTDDGATILSSPDGAAWRPVDLPAGARADTDHDVLTLHRWGEGALLVSRPVGGEIDHLVASQLSPTTATPLTRQTLTAGWYADDLIATSSLGMFVVDPGSRTLVHVREGSEARVVDLPAELDVPSDPSPISVDVVATDQALLVAVSSGDDHRLSLWRYAPVPEEP